MRAALVRRAVVDATDRKCVNATSAAGVVYRLAVPTGNRARSYHVVGSVYATAISATLFDEPLFCVCSYPPNGGGGDLNGDLPGPACRKRIHNWDDERKGAGLARRDGGRGGGTLSCAVTRPSVFAMSIVAP
jgi:hypothetical protein